MDVTETLPEFSRPVSLEEIDLTNPATEIEANAQERAALARRFGLLRLDAFAATVSFEVASTTTVIMSATMVAEVIQECVVTLEPVFARISERFERRFRRGEGNQSTEVQVEPEADDLPDPWDGGAIDIGEVVAEQLGLSIDSYPRRPGAVFVGPRERNSIGSMPFASLAAIKEP